LDYKPTIILEIYHLHYYYNSAYTKSQEIFPIYQTFITFGIYYKKI